MLITFNSEIRSFNSSLSLVMCTVHTAGHALPYLTPMNVKSHVDVPSSQKNLKLSILICLKCLNILNLTKRHSPTHHFFWSFNVPIDFIITMSQWYYVYKYAIQHLCNACVYCTHDV